LNAYFSSEEDLQSKVMLKEKEEEMLEEQLQRMQTSKERVEQERRRELEDLAQIKV